MSYGPPPEQPPGTYPPPYGYAGPPPPNNGKAVTSLVLGIVSLVACGLLTGIPAMILGRRAKREIQASEGREGGESLATAGFVTGLVGTIITSLAAVFVIGVFVVGALVADTFQETCEEVFAGDEFSVEC